MFKHYIRINSDNYIIHSFTDGFETPLETDICIEEGDRCWSLQIMTMDGLYNYKYENDSLILITEKEKKSSTAYLTIIRNRKKDEIKSAYLKEKTETRNGIMSATLGVKIDCRELDYDQTKALKEYLEAKGLTSTNSYKVYDNSYITVTTDQLNEVLKEILCFQVELWNKKDALLNKINSLSSIEEINVVTWE